MIRRDPDTGRFLPLLSTNLARALHSVSLLRNDPAMVQRSDGAWRYCGWLFGPEEEAA